MADLVATLRTIVGRRHVLTGAGPTRRYRTGYRFGEGDALAVVRPGSLVELWRVAQACVAADVIIIAQAANTGLTGGSTPDGVYDRPVVIISTARLKGLQPIDGGRQVIALPGATLYELERLLRPMGREPHSVIGSSCFGASVIGGVCNNSGGALVRRGPAYTELALYARRDAEGRLELVNHLGVALGNDAETMLHRLERGDYEAHDVALKPGGRASDADYAEQVRRVDASSPARFNADPRCLHEVAGCAGHLIVFAVRLDTFPAEAGAKVFYIGTNDPAELTRLRRAILRDWRELPIAGEYMHRTAFDIARRYGKDLFLAVRHLGTDRLPRLFALKARVDAVASRLRLFGDAPSDGLAQGISALFPEHLPARLLAYRDRFEHHLMLKIDAGDANDARAALSALFPSAAGDYFECTDDEGAKAFLHRFAAAGAAVRYRAMHRDRVEDIVALDIALPRDATEWVECLPPAIEAPILHKLYYGHFLCHVFHQDYIVRKGADVLDLEHRMWAGLDARGAEYPAEHNVGHLYPAKPALAGFYRALDPTNSLNPGIGQTSKARDWA